MPNTFAALLRIVFYHFLLMVAVLVAGCQGNSEPTAEVSPSTESEASDTQETTDADGESLTGNAQADPVLEDWSFFRGGPLAQGFVADSKLPDRLDVVWEYEAEKTAFEGSPVHQNGKVVVGDLDGKLWCFDVLNGKELWSKEAKTTYIASPTLLDDGIYIGDGDGYFHKFDWSGNEVWTFEAGASIDSAANFYKDRVLFGSQDAVLYCLKREDGSEVWNHRTDDQIRCSIVVAEDQTYVAGCDGRLHLVNLESGEGQGEVPLGAVTGSTPATWGDRVYFGMEDGQFVCIDVNAKELVWDWRHEQGEAAIRGSAALDGERVIFGNRASLVVCLKMSDGSSVWERKVDRKVDGSPVIVGNRVYVGDGSGKLLVLDKENGEVVQEMELIGAILGSPCVVGDRLIVATDEGMVYCLGTP